MRTHVNCLEIIENMFLLSCFGVGPFAAEKLEKFSMLVLSAPSPSKSTQ